MCDGPIGGHVPKNVVQPGSTLEPLGISAKLFWHVMCYGSTLGHVQVGAQVGRTLGPLRGTCPDDDDAWCAMVLIENMYPELGCVWGAP